MKLPNILRNEAKDESYEYFDKNIRLLPKDSNGKIDPTQSGFHDNDVDAFRHAYVSGVFTQEYSEIAADIFGRLNEFMNPANIYSNATNRGSENMDLWNNAIGRKYGLKAKDRKSLLKMIHKALEGEELIVTPNDQRRYEGASTNSLDSSKPVIVLEESKEGRNEVFFDLKKKTILTRNEFISMIQAGQYPDYSVKTIRRKFIQ